MPNNDEADKQAVHLFANTLTASDDIRPFVYLRGEREKIETTNTTAIPLAKFSQAMPEQFEGDDPARLSAINAFWTGISGSDAPFSSSENAYQWLYDHLAAYAPFGLMFQQCRGTAVSLQELAETIFPAVALEDALHAVEVMLAIAPLARSNNGSVFSPHVCTCYFGGLKVSTHVQILNAVTLIQPMD